MLITTRQLREAQLTISMIALNVFSKGQKGPTLRSRFSSSEKAIGRVINPVSKSASAKHARSIVELFRSRRLFATAKMTKAFRRIVGMIAAKSILARATRCLFVSSFSRYSFCQASTFKLQISFSGSRDLEMRLRRKNVQLRFIWYILLKVYVCSKDNLD